MAPTKVSLFQCLYELMKAISIICNRILRGIFKRGIFEVDVYESQDKKKYPLECSTINYIVRHGYPAELHYTTTEDGYILGLQRIPYGKTQPKILGTKCPVLIVHGFLSTSAEMVGLCDVPDKCLPYKLASLGYDVWLGNTRGTAWSQNHETLDIRRNAKDYWNFCLTDIACKDLPAMIDYVLAKTNAEKFHYLSFSQGSAAFLMMASCRPEYNEKVRLASCMAPISFQNHSEATVFKYLSQNVLTLKKLSTFFHIYSFPFPDTCRWLAKLLCRYVVFRPICHEMVFFSVGNRDERQLNQKQLARIFSNCPTNCSVDQLVHFGFMIKSGRFQHFDYGEKENLKRYGTKTPPDFDVSKVTCPVALFYGPNDVFINAKDAKHLASLIPNLVLDYEVPFDCFNHVDLLMARDVAYLVYAKLIEMIEKY